MANKGMSGLGKGLKALLPLSSNEDAFSLEGNEENKTESPFFYCPTRFIIPNPYQPRKEFIAEELESLAASIREKGILQPIVVRKIDENKYELIAGERRLRAAQLAQLEKVPTLIKDIAVSDRLELALIENIQREGLNPLEEAGAYAQLIEEFGMTQEVVAKRVGKKRSTVANSIRLLQLPDFARESLSSGAISAGHARVLLGLLPDIELIEELHSIIVSKKLSVREAEEWARNEKKRKLPPRKKTNISTKKAAALPESYCKSINTSLGNYLGTKSKIMQNGERGKIEIEYKSTDDLERLLSLILQEQ